LLSRSSLKNANAAGRNPANRVGSCVIGFPPQYTVLAVPTGMKTGVSIARCAVASRPRGALPSRASTSNRTLTGPVPLWTYDS
jgi:hypothetical protein